MNETIPICNRYLEYEARMKQNLETAGSKADMEKRLRSWTDPPKRLKSFYSGWPLLVNSLRIERVLTVQRLADAAERYAAEVTSVWALLEYGDWVQ